MSYEIALVNPRRKVAKMAKRKKRAKRRMTAKQLKYFGSKAQRKRASGANVATRKKRRRGAKRAKSRRSTAVVVHSPKRRRRRAHGVGAVKKYRRRRNPRLLSGVAGDVVGTLIPAGIGAAGVIAADKIIGYLPLQSLSSDPSTQKQIARVVRVLGAAGIGVLAKKFGAPNANAIGAAAMGVAIHGVISSFLPAGFLPPTLGGDDDGDMGEYMMGDDVITDPAPLLSGEIDGDDDLSGEIDGVGEYMQGDDTY